MQKQLSKFSSRQGASEKNMNKTEFPIGCVLTDIFVVEDQKFAGDELCLDQIQFIFTDKMIVLQPIVDTDEIEIIHENTIAPVSEQFPIWCSGLLGKTLQTVWICENAQGYRDQVIFAFDRLHPTLALIAEGSVLKVFRCEQLLQKQFSPA